MHFIKNKINQICDNVIAEYKRSMDRLMDLEKVKLTPEQLEMVLVINSMEMKGFWHTSRVLADVFKERWPEKSPSSGGDEGLNQP